MNAIAEAKAGIKATRARFRRAVTLLLGSPVAMAVSAVMTLSFGAQALYAPGRLPPVGGLSLAQVGLPSLDLGGAGDMLREASDAAIRQGGLEQARGFLSEHAALIPWLNIAGFVFFALFFVWTLWIQARNYRQPKPLY